MVSSCRAQTPAQPTALAISARMAGGVKEMLAVTQQLVERVREERAAR